MSEESAADPPPPAPDGAAPDTEITVSPGLGGWLRAHDVSLAFTCYQNGQLFLAGAHPSGNATFSQQQFGRAMGVAWKSGRLHLGTMYQLWRLENLLRPGEMSSRVFDAVLVPRTAQTIGDIDIHELGIAADGRPIFVNTKYSCLCTTDPVHSFKPIWKPSFISALEPEDRCHLNGLAMDKGRPRYVTALRRADTADGWRDGPEAGVLIEVETNRIVTERLSMPHSPRVAGGVLYALESGRGWIVRIDPRSGETTDLAFCPGFLRGLAIHDGHAIVTVSKPRRNDFDGLPLDHEMAARGSAPWCGVMIIDLASGELVEWIRLDGHIIQLFDVATLPGVRCPMALGPGTPEMRGAITFDPLVTRPATRPGTARAMESAKRRGRR